MEFIYNRVTLLLMGVTVIQISFAYPNQAMEVNISPPNLNTKTLPDTSVCGTNTAKDKIHGGELAEIGEFPWLVALEYKFKGTDIPAGIKCGGTLINSRYVLTAAHCLTHQEFQLINVRLGEWNTTADPDCQSELPVGCADSVKKIKIKQEIPHRFYKSTSGDNDIGLLKLERDVEYTSYVRPICLPVMNIPFPEFGSNLTVAGWGATEQNEKSNVLLKVEIPLVPNRNCSSKLDVEELDGNFLCAGGESGKDACQGDSGGPLMRLHEDPVSQEPRWYQEGVVAYGSACGREGYPAVYTRVSRYMIWIIRNINKD